MTDDELKKRLADLRVPAPSDEARAKVLHRARMALANAKNAGIAEPETSRESAPWRWFWGGGLAAALVLVASFVWRPSAENPLAWQKTLEQVETLFPGQINAVIERDGALALDLSETARGGDAQPVLVEFVRGAKVLRVLSYSGRRICVDLGGTKACFEPLVTADGGVILAGENFLWSSENPATHAGFHVAAWFLHPTS